MLTRRGPSLRNPKAGVGVPIKFAAAALAGSLLLAGLAGCNSGTTTSPAASTADPATSTTPKPEITNPLNTNAFAANTCAGLTDAQVAPYLGGLRNKTPEESSNGPLCALLPENISGPTVGVGVSNLATPTQELLYESLQNFPWSRKISPIAGYPAVDASTAYSSTQGDCGTDVAINAKQSLHLQFTDTSTSDPYYTKPCVVTEALMADLIQNIKSGVV